MRVLFVNHTGDFSGAEAAMLRLLETLPPRAEVAVACPPGGRLSAIAAEAGVTRFDITGTDVSFALDARRTGPALAALARSVVDVRRIARRWGADVVHANSVRAGLMGALALRLGGPPLVTQIHDGLPPGPLGRVVRATVASGSARVVGVSDWVAARFNHGLVGGTSAERAYIAIDSASFVPDDAAGLRVRASLGIAPDTPVIGHVAQISRWKGQHVAIGALRTVRERYPDARLLIVGDVAFDKEDNHAYRAEIVALVRQLELEDGVLFLGFRRDVADLLNAIDILMLPSVDEPFGTVVVEAMGVGTIPLVAASGGVVEIIGDGGGGRIVATEDAGAWGAAATDLLADPALRAELTAGALRRAADFTPAVYADTMLRTYESAAGRT